LKARQSFIAFPFYQGIEKYSLGSSFEKKKGKENHGIKISKLDRESLTSIKSCPNTYCIW
jgi:hypothetical protein